jgi:pyruvate dehydrogenase E2 component (dihydrolipoyllysine-residue acetyltransferase)
MAREFKLPDIGEGISEVELLRWYVQEGDVVQEDQNLAEIETDKAVADLPSPYAGVIRRLHHQPGERIAVGSVLVSFAEDETGPTKTEPAPIELGAEAPLQTAAAPGVALERDGSAAEPAVGRVLATPATRRRARDLSVDLSTVQGTGPGGRITLDDVERIARGGGQKPAAEEAPSREIAAPPVVPGRVLPEPVVLPNFSQWGPVEHVILSATRRQIARKMVHSLFTAPHAAALDEVDVTELEAFRKQAQERLQDRHIHLTLLPFVMKATVGGLKQFPALNASLDDEKQELILKRYYHLGIAVDTERGLIVPVLRDVDRKSLLDLAVELGDKIERSRAGKISLDELRGGTFTLTNAGAIGGHAFIPIINYPEVAILGIGRAQPKPVVRDGQIVVRTMLPLSIAFDHRVIDGADVVRFLILVMRMLADPMQLLLDA